MSKATLSAKSVSKEPLLTIMVPVYNEGKTILQILKAVTSLPIDNYEIIVINDASADRSLAVIDKFKKSFKSSRVNLKIESHPKNRGKGAAIKTALKNASGTYFVIQDADLEYAPRDIPPLLEAVFKDDLDVVYGSRFLGSIKGMPKPNYYANRFYNFMLRRLYKTKITDMHTCYKMVKTPLLKDLKMTSDGFDYASELVSKLLRRGINIREVPISFTGRTKIEGKKIGYKDGIECIYKLIRYRFSNTI